MAEGALARWWRARAPWQQLAIMAALGAEAALGHAPYSLPVFTFVGLGLAFALFAVGSGTRQAFFAGMALGTGYFALTLSWIVEPFLVDVARYGWMAPFALVFLSVGLSLFWGGAFAVARHSGRGVWALVPALAGAELLRAYVFTGFPWGMPGYVLVDGRLGQMAAWIGPHGLNLVLFAGLAAISRMRPAGLAAGGIVLGAALWPVPAAGPLPEDAPIVRLVQPNAPQHLKWKRAYMRRFFERAIAATQAATSGARPALIVWPETSVPVVLNDAHNTLAVIAEAADGVPVVLGINRLDGNRAYNSAVVLNAAGQVSAIYDKHHIVPFGEYVPFGDLLAQLGIHGLAARDGDGFSAGPGPRLVSVGALGRAQPLICYEAVFPQDVFGIGARPDFLMQITNDAWFGNFSGPYQHLQQARMRAIEMGLPLIRAANTGVSAVIDARGRIIAALPLNTDGHLDAPLPPVHAATFYSRSGDLPLAFFLVLVNIWLLYRARRKTD